MQLKKVSHERKKKIEYGKIPEKEASGKTKKVKEEVKKSLAKVIKVYHQ